MPSPAARAAPGAATTGGNRDTLHSMIAKAMSCVVHGLSGVPVTVEVDVANGLPSFTIVGLTDRSIQEARERVRVAVRSAGFDFPARRITVNLAPAEVPKEGTGFDLAIASALLRHGDGRLALDGVGLIGELALDGSVRGVVGVLPMARRLLEAGIRTLLVPSENAAEAALVEGVSVFGVERLGDAVAHLRGARRLAAAPPPPMGAVPQAPGTDLASVRGQALAKRALEIAAGGRHNVLMLGPPGSGKTMLARALGGLLPDLSVDEALEVAAIYSLRGRLADRPPTSLRPPFRAPHHSVSRAGLVGGGAGLAQPGEVSLAHRGVLLLDEVCEFPRAHLEALRQPVEERRVVVTRVRGTVVFPAELILVAAANPCPCGRLGQAVGEGCRCPAEQVVRYQARLSGPMRDRIDIVVDVPRVEGADLFGEREEESSGRVRERVAAARARQRERAARAGATANALVPGERLLEICGLDARGRDALTRAGERGRLSARGYHRVLRVARTVSDLRGDERVTREAVIEALQLRGQAG